MFIFLNENRCLKHTLRISVNISGINKLAQNHMKKDESVKKMNESERKKERERSNTEL